MYRTLQPDQWQILQVCRPQPRCEAGLFEHRQTSLVSAEEVEHVQASDDEDDEDFYAELSDSGSTSSASSSESEVEQAAETSRLNARELEERCKGAMQLKASTWGSFRPCPRIG